MALGGPRVVVATVATLAAVASVSWARSYERCELARELSDVHGVPQDQLATWVCVAWHESRFDTAAVGRLSGSSLDLGIFQISDLFWCGSLAPTPPPSGGLTVKAGGGCGVECLSLVDDDIADDVLCAKTILRQHARLSPRGDGWTAWAVYQRGDCPPHRAEAFIADCFPSNTTDTSAPTGADDTTRPPLGARHDKAKKSLKEKT